MASRVPVRATVDAGKQRFEREDLPGLFAGARRVVVAKGRKEVAFELEPDAPQAPRFGLLEVPKLLARRKRDPWEGFDAARRSLVD